MKLWTSASAIGLSATYLVAACSSPATDDNGYHPTTAGTASTAGSPGASGNTGTAGSGTAGSTPGTAGNSTGGVAPTAGAGTGGNAAAGNTTGGNTTAGVGGATPGAETEIPCPANVQGHCSMGATYPTYPGFTLNLVEDFPAAIDLDKDPVMTWSDGAPESGQTGFRKEQITFAGGKMLITAQPGDGCMSKTTNPGCIAPRASFGEAKDPNAQAQVEAMGVWSGELRSKYNNYRYGRYEAKFSAPLANPAQATMSNASGFLATMFLFRTPKNVQWNEIDVELEPNIFNAYQGNVVNAAKAGGYPAGNAHAIMPLGPAGYHIAQEHIYAFNWTPTKVEWFLDGVSIESFAGSAADPIPTMSGKIMMNLWVFSGDHFGPSAMNQYPIHSTYDYFRFYKFDTEAKYPCTPVPGCLDPADKTKSSQNNPTETNYGM